MTVGTDRTIDNSLDSERKWPTTALAEKVLTSKEGVVVRLLGGTNNTPIALDQPIYPGSTVFVLAFVTASGAAAAQALLQSPADFTITEENANGVGEITPTGDESLNTLLVAYSPRQPEGTIGGQSAVG